MTGVERQKVTVHEAGRVKAKLLKYPNCIVQRKSQRRSSQELSSMYQSSLELCPVRPIQVLVAVHGLDGNAAKTWTYESGNICWLNHPEFRPRDAKHARVLAWGYNVNISSGIGKSMRSGRILQHAQTVIAQLVVDRDAWVFSSLSSMRVMFQTPRKGVRRI